MLEAVVKKTFCYSNVFLLQPLIPAFPISEFILEKRYNIFGYSEAIEMAGQTYHPGPGRLINPVAGLPLQMKFAVEVKNNEKFPREAKYGTFLPQGAN